MRVRIAGRRSQVTLHELAWRAWRLGHESGACLHPDQRRMPGSRPGNSTPGLAVLAEVRREGQRGDVLLSRGTAHRVELAAEGPATPVKTAAVAGSASLNARHERQRRASSASRDRWTALRSDSPIAENGCGIGADVLRP